MLEGTLSKSRCNCYATLLTYFCLPTFKLFAARGLLVNLPRLIYLAFFGWTVTKGYGIP
jgi:hypothetical protein